MQAQGDSPDNLNHPSPKPECDQACGIAQIEVLPSLPISLYSSMIALLQNQAIQAQLCTLEDQILHGQTHLAEAVATLAESMQLQISRSNHHLYQLQTGGSSAHNLVQTQIYR